MITEGGGTGLAARSLIQSQVQARIPTLKKGWKRKKIFFPFFFCCAEANYAYVVFPQKKVEKCVAACRRINKNVEASFFCAGQKRRRHKRYSIFGKRPRKNIFEREMCRRRSNKNISISIHLLAEPLIFLPLFRTSKVLRLIGKKKIIKFLKPIRAKK